jgi:hypothetical protein
MCNTHTRTYACYRRAHVINSNHLEPFKGMPFKSIAPKQRRVIRRTLPVVLGHGPPLYAASAVVDCEVVQLMHSLQSLGPLIVRDGI